MSIDNIFKNIDRRRVEEIFETLYEKPGIKIERIVSTGQSTPEGEFYDQATDEWVVLLTGSAELSYPDTGERLRLTAGEYVFIPARRRHRVESTSSDPACVWIAVHF